MPSDVNKPRPDPADINRPRPETADLARARVDTHETSRSVPELLNNLVGQISTLFRKEVQLARAEMGEKFGEASSAVMPIGAGAGLLIASLVVLLFSLAAAITAWFDIATGWSLLIVGLAFSLFGYLLVRSGMSRLKVTTLMPERTADQLSRDAQVAKEQVR